MKKRKSIWGIVVIFSLLFANCEKEQILPAADNSLHIHRLKAYRQFSSPAIANRVVKKLLFEDTTTHGFLKTFEKSNGVKFDFGQAFASTYQGTEWMMLSFKGKGIHHEEYTLCMLFKEEIKEGHPLKFLGGVILKTASSPFDHTTYFRLDGEVLGALSLRNEKFVEMEVPFEKARPKNCPKYLGEAWCHFGGCVKYTLSRFTDGSVSGSLMGLGCLAFGPECALTIGGGCFIGALIVSDW